ncbi:hypothetical protein [Paenibacillus xylanexedens]|jgi:hypothetical protein|uniref:hypothetical protein n=1 Tax=Paenibacillus xylanexedens TaxID=528191 RepID=UPI00138AC4B7
MPLMTWATHVLQWPVQRAAKSRDGANPNKAGLSSDCRLQLACMKSELLVIADQHAAVNTFPGLVHTARHTTRVYNTRSRWGNRKEPAAEGGIDDWGEVVTR